MVSPEKYKGENSPINLSDKEFIIEAEKQGNVWESLNGFQDSFNRDDISDMWFIRFINKNSIVK